MTRAAILSACLVLSIAGCRSKDNSSDTMGATPPSPGVTRCNAGIAKAVKATTLETAMTTYYEECADLSRKPECSAAWHAAAKAAPAERLPIVADACRKVYCPELGAYGLEMCRPDFAGTDMVLAKAWSSFFNAVVEREAAEYAGQVQTGMMTFFIRTKQIEAEMTARGEPLPNMSAAPAGSGAPAPSGAAPAGSASAAPSASAATVAAPKVAPSASAKPSAPKPSAPAPKPSAK